jgi:hypothetical protein
MKHLFVVRTGIEPVYGILSFIITTGEGHIGLCSLTSTIPSPDYFILVTGCIFTVSTSI